MPIYWMNMTWFCRTKEDCTLRSLPSGLNSLPSQEPSYLALPFLSGVLGVRSCLLVGIHPIILALYTHLPLGVHIHEPSKNPHVSINAYIIKRDRSPKEANPLPARTSLRFLEGAN